jgi:hypothetical protein
MRAQEPELGAAYLLASAQLPPPKFVRYEIANLPAADAVGWPATATLVCGSCGQKDKHEHYLLCNTVCINNSKLIN